MAHHGDLDGGVRNRARHLTEDEVEEVSITATEGLNSKLKVK